MGGHLRHIILSNFRTQSDALYDSLPLSYECFGRPLGEAPIVLVNHAMTANSTITGENGWWTPIIGEGKVIDTNRYTVLAFNVPGNGYDGFFIERYQDFSARDASKAFLKGLDYLGISKLFATIGSSVGGAITWEICVQAPELSDYIIPIATDWKATDWLLANIHVQKQILNNSNRPLQDARIHAMNFYRTPQSYKQKFNRSINPYLKMYNVESWLAHHGNKIEARYSLMAYKLMNHLVGTIDITEGRGEFEEVVADVKSKIHMIGIDSDLLFIPEENRDALRRLRSMGKDADYCEIKSIHGHDAFLIEFKQLEQFLSPIFKS